MKDKKGNPLRGGDRVLVTLTFEARVYDWMGFRETFVDPTHPDAPFQVQAPRFGLFPVTVSSREVEKLR